MKIYKIILLSLYIIINHSIIDTIKEDYKETRELIQETIVNLDNISDDINNLIIINDKIKNTLESNEIILSDIANHLI